MSEALRVAFQDLLEKYDLCAPVDDLVATPYGVQYEWDGIMTCHVVMTKDFKFVNVADEPTLPANLTSLPTFGSLESLVRECLVGGDE